MTHDLGSADVRVQRAMLIAALRTWDKPADDMAPHALTVLGTSAT